MLRKLVNQTPAQQIATEKSSAPIDIARGRNKLSTSCATSNQASAVGSPVFRDSVKATLRQSSGSGGRHSFEGFRSSPDLGRRSDEIRQDMRR
jgi:cytochrome c5